jgi:adenosylcobinamide kinase/adenosylcobinamide-phosphate guanylyltransferase
MRCGTQRVENQIPTTLIIGGCRSGKSRHALSMGEALRGGRNFFLATCVPSDEEMRARVHRHRQERGPRWNTIEEPFDIDRTLLQNGPGADVIIVDCLTLWATNLLLRHDSDDDVMRCVDRLDAVLSAPPCPIILVTNEVGAGIVPENALARRFRDLTGWINQRVARCCGRVVWMVAGIPVTIKPSGQRESG